MHWSVSEEGPRGPRGVGSHCDKNIINLETVGQLSCGRQCKMLRNWISGVSWAQTPAGQGGSEEAAPGTWERSHEQLGMTVWDPQRRQPCHLFAERVTNIFKGKSYLIL